MTLEFGGIEHRPAAQVAVHPHEFTDLSYQVDLFCDFLLTRRSNLLGAYGARGWCARGTRQTCRLCVCGHGHAEILRWLRGRDELADLANRIRSSPHARLQRGEIVCERLGAVPQEMGLAILVRHLREHVRHGGDEPLLLVGDNADDRDLHRANAFEERHQVVLATIGLALAEERLPTDSVPHQVEHRRPVVELDPIAHEHNPALRPQPRAERSLIPASQLRERHEIAENAARMTLIDGQPPLVQVARDSRKREPVEEVALSDVQRHLEAVDALREHNAQVSGRVKDGSRSRTARVAALVPPLHPKPSFESLYAAPVDLIHTQHAFTVRTSLLKCRVNQVWARSPVRMAHHHGGPTRTTASRQRGSAV